MSMSELGPNLNIVLLLACSPGMVLLLHIIASRIIVKLGHSISPQIVAICCAIGGNMPMAVLAWLVSLRHLVKKPLELAWAIVYCFAVYNALAYIYFHLFNMSETARRFRILYELDKTGSISTTSSDATYGATSMLSARLDRLMAMRQIVRRGERYTLGNHSLYYVAKVVAAWGKLLRFQ